MLIISTRERTTQYSTFMGNVESDVQLTQEQWYIKRLALENEYDDIVYGRNINMKKKITAYYAMGADVEHDRAPVMGITSAYGLAIDEEVMCRNGMTCGRVIDIKGRTAVIQCFYDIVPLISTAHVNSVLFDYDCDITKERFAIVRKDGTGGVKAEIVHPARWIVGSSTQWLPTLRTECGESERLIACSSPRTLLGGNPLYLVITENPFIGDVVAMAVGSFNMVASDGSKILFNAFAPIPGKLFKFKGISEQMLKWAGSRGRLVGHFGG